MYYIVPVRRAARYAYMFTIVLNRYSKKDWWVREEKNEYFPALEKDNESLIDYLRRSKILMVCLSIGNIFMLLGISMICRTCTLGLKGINKYFPYSKLIS